MYVDQEALAIHLYWVGAPPDLPEPRVGKIHVTDTGITLADHQEVLSTIATSLRPHGVGEDDVVIDFAAQRYVVTTPNPEAMSSEVHDTSSGWLVDVRSGPSASADAYLYSGLNLNLCTTGFTLRKLGTSQTLYSSTAGHCGTPVKRSGTTLSPVSGGRHFYGVYDVRWFHPSSFTLKNWQQDTTSGGSTFYYRTITSTRNTSYMQGDTVCKMGRTTGWTCGEITDFTSSGKARVARSGVNLSSEGDSGAGWFSGNAAYGIHSQGSGNAAFFMPVGYLNDLGVTVFTG